MMIKLGNKHKSACQIPCAVVQDAKINPQGSGTTLMFNKEDIIDMYTTRQAVEDGTLIQVDQKISEEAGIKHPVYITRGVWKKYVEVNPQSEVPQHQEGRLWDILYMFSNYARNAPDTDTVYFKLFCVIPRGLIWERNEDSAPTTQHRTVTLKAVIAARDFDDPSPAIFIMKPHED